MKKIIYLLVAIGLCGFFSAAQTKKLTPQEEELEEKTENPREGELADRNRNDRERNDISLYEKNEQRLRRQAERNQAKMRCQRCQPQYHYQNPDEYQDPYEDE